MKIVKNTTYPENIIMHIVNDDTVGDINTFDGILQEKEQLIEALEKMYATLTPKEQTVINLRYKEKKSYSEIGKVLGVGRERIRTINNKSLRKLRYPVRKRALYGKEIVFKKEKIEPEFPFLDSLKLSKRTYNCLIRAGFIEECDFINAEGNDFLYMRGLGRTCFNELQSALKKKNIIIDLC